MSNQQHHHHRWKLNDQDAKQDRYLTEGCCPSCHHSMIRIGEYQAACGFCGIEWKSKRVAVVFPDSSSKDAI